MDVEVSNIHSCLPQNHGNHNSRRLLSKVFQGNRPQLIELTIAHLNKRLVVGMTVIAIIILSVAILAQVERGGTPSSLSSVSSVSNESTATSSSSSSSSSTTSFP